MVNVRGWSKTPGWKRKLLPSTGSAGRHTSATRYSYRNRWRDFSLPVNDPLSPCLKNNQIVELSSDDEVRSHCSKSSNENSDDDSSSSELSGDVSIETVCSLSEDEEDDSSCDNDDDLVTPNVNDGHVLLRMEDLDRLLTDHLRCNCGARRAKVIRRTVGISTQIDYFCTVCENRYSIKPEMNRSYNECSGDENEKERLFVRLDSHALNNRLILLTQLLGASRKASSFIAGMLDLSSKYTHCRYRQQEDHVGWQEIVLAEKIMIENQLREIEGLEPDENGRYCVAVGGDAGWQQGQKKYNSPSGHAMLVGQRLFLVLALIVYSKLCCLCAAAKRKGREPAAHACSKNYEGSSKGMEAKGILKLVTNLWENTKLAVTTYVSDRDSSTRAVLSPEKPDDDKDKGKLPAEHYPVTFFTDPNHIVRSFGSKVYKLSRMSKKKSLMSRSDAPRLKRNFSYWARRGNKGCLVIYRRQSRAVVEHHFNNHTYCSTDFCKLKDKNPDELVKLTKYRCKKIHEKLYNQAMEALNKYTDETSLRELMHNMHTQKNESLNRVAMRYAPKQFCFARTKALTYRLHLAVGIDSVGHYSFYDRLFELVGIEMSKITSDVLSAMDAVDKYQSETKKNLPPSQKGLSKGMHR
jgi:hypothetical protein